jgi:hypothetical protein
MGEETASAGCRTIAPYQTDHLVSNLSLASQFGAQVVLQRQEVRIEGLGCSR